MPAVCLSGFASWDQASRGHKRDTGIRHVFNGRGRLDLVGEDYRNLCLERPAVDLRRQHVDGTLRARLIRAHDLPGASYIALLDRRADLLAARELQSEGGHVGRGLPHGGGAFAGLEYVDATAVLLGSRVLLMHGGHSPDSAFLGQPADLAAGQAVPARVEGRPGDDDIRFEAVERLARSLQGCLGLLVRVVVAAYQRADDLALIAHKVLDKGTGAHRAFHGLEGHPGFLVAAPSGEELVQVVDYTDRHVPLLSLLGLAWRMLTERREECRKRPGGRLGYSPFLMKSATRSPIAIVVTLVLARMQSGMIDASATLRASSPWTFPNWSTTAIGSEAGPILHVPDM